MYRLQFHRFFESSSEWSGQIPRISAKNRRSSANSANSFQRSRERNDNASEKRRIPISTASPPTLPRSMMTTSIGSGESRGSWRDSHSSKRDDKTRALGREGGDEGGGGERKESLPSKFLFLARSARRTSWLGAASAKSAASWCEGGNEGPKGGIAVVGGRGIMTGAEPNAGNASPPAVWWRGLCGGGGPELGSVGSVATGCTAADMDRSTPPNSTGRHPPEPGPLLTAGRIPPPPGSGAYGKYSSSINRRGISRGNNVRSSFSSERTTSPRMPPSQHRSTTPSLFEQRGYFHFPLSTTFRFSPTSAIEKKDASRRSRSTRTFVPSSSPVPDIARLRPSTRSASPPLFLSLDRPKFLRNLVTERDTPMMAIDRREPLYFSHLPMTLPVCLGRERFPVARRIHNDPYLSRPLSFRSFLYVYRDFVSRPTLTNVYERDSLRGRG